MRKVQKILAGVFLGGVLLGGIGTGIALAEYSSISYGGRQVIGQESLVTEVLDYSFDPEKGPIRLSGEYLGVNRDGMPTLDWAPEADASVPEGVIRYEVTYNKETVRPSLYFHEYSEEDREEAQGALFLTSEYMDHDFARWMENKDRILAELKQGKISEYQVLYIEQVKVSVNPETLDFVEMMR